MKENNYKVVISLEFPDGTIEYVIWEMELYGKLCYLNADFQSMFQDQSKFKTPPVDVLFEIWNNPSVSTIEHKIGNEITLKQICTGSRVIPLKRF